MAADTDQDGETDAEERLAELQGIVLTDLDDEAVDEESDAPSGPARPSSQAGAPSDPA